MSIWFEKEEAISCTIQLVKESFENIGEHYVAVVSRMPGLASVDLIDQGSDFLHIRTNEGLMKRSQITKHVDTEGIRIDYREEYQAGTKITVKSHVSESFTASETGVDYRVVISDVEATGILGFFYRTFGKASIGRSLVQATKTYFER